MMLGAGRQTKDEIDLSVGIVLNKKVGDVVKRRIFINHSQ